MLELVARNLFGDIRDLGELTQPGFHGGVNVLRFRYQLELRGLAVPIVAAYAAGGLATCDALERHDFDVVGRAIRPARRDEAGRQRVRPPPHAPTSFASRNNFV